MDLLIYWWKAVRRYPLTTTLSVGSILVLTVCVILFFPREYRSQAKLLLRVGHESATLDPTADATGQMMQMQRSQEHDTYTELQVMRSRVLLEEVVDELGPELILSGTLPGDESAAESSPGLLSGLKSWMASIDPVSEREHAIRKLEKSIDIFSDEKSSLVNVETHSKTPEAAQTISRAWVDAYLTKHADFHNTEGSLEFFRDEDDKLRHLLDEAYANRREAKSSDGLVTVVGQQELLEGQLAAVRGLLMQVESDLAGSASRAQSLRKILASTEDRTVTDEVSGKANEAHDTMRGRLFDLEVIEREYSSKYKDDHPRLESVRRQLSEAREIVANQKNERNEVTSGINPVYQELEQELLLETAMQESLAKKKVALAEQHAQLQQEAATLNETEEQIASIDREILILEGRYAAHAERMEQARIDAVLEEKQINSVNEVQPPTLEERPATPNKKLVAMLGLMASIAVGFGVPLVLAGAVDYPKLAEAATVPLPPAENTRQTDTVERGQKWYTKHDEEQLMHPMFSPGAQTTGDSEEQEATDSIRRKAR